MQILLSTELYKYFDLENSGEKYRDMNEEEKNKEKEVLIKDFERVGY